MKKFGLVIIGAHIGVHLFKDINDYKDQNILLVEPVPHNLKQLKKNTAEYKNVIIDPCAVGDKKKINDFYFVKGDSIHKLGKHWASGIGSFSKKHILEHRTKRFKIQESDIDSIKIQTLTFLDLIKKYKISEIDKLQIDVEGYEFAILNSIDYSIKINKIIFESKHFDGTFNEGPKLNKIKNKLIKNNYNIVQLDKENILAKKTTFD